LKTIALYNEPVGMAIKPGWRAMGSPASVGDAGVRVKDLREIRLDLLDELFQLGNFSNLLEGHDLVPLIAIDSKAGGIVSAILQTLKTYRLVSTSSRKGSNRWKW